MRGLVVVIVLAVLAVMGLYGDHWMGLHGARPLMAQDVVRVAPTVNVDTLAVIRYGVDMEMLRTANIFIACYITNPKRFGKGHPSLSCVATPMTPQ